MILDFPTIFSLMKVTLQNPKAGLRRILDLGLPAEARWTAFFLVAVLSAMLTVVSLMLLPAAMREAVAAAAPNPLIATALQTAILLLTAKLIHVIGRLCGGAGTFGDSLLAMVWLQLILLVVQAAQVLSQAVFLPLAELIGFAAIGMFFWLMSNFIAEVHGFRSLLRVFVGMFGTLFVAAFVIAAIILPMFGISLQGA